MKDFIKKNSKVVIGVSIAFGVVILGLLGYLGWNYYEKNVLNKEVLAVVGNDEITVTELNEKIYLVEQSGTPENPGEVSEEKKKDLLGELIEYSVIAQEIVKNSVVISNDEVKALAEKFPGYASYPSLYLKDARSYLEKQWVEDNLLGWKSGRYAIIHFDQNFVGDDNEVSDPSLVAQDKEYADKLKLELEELAFDEIYSGIEKDSRVGAAALPSAYTVGSFTKEDYRDKLEVIQARGVYDTIANTPVGQKSAFITGKVVVDDQEVDGYYFAVEVTNGQTGAALNYADWVNKKKTEYEIEIRADYAKTLAEVLSQKAFAATATTDADSVLGVNTGLTTDWAGLVVKTQFQVSPTSLVLATVNGTKVEDVDSNNQAGVASLTIKEGVDGSGNKICMTKNPARVASKTFDDTYYYKGVPGDCNNGAQYYKEGYLVLGKGVKSSSVSNFGNRWLLDCDDTSNVANTFRVTPPSRYVYGGAEYEAVASDNFNVSNGYTKFVTITYTHVIPPVVKYSLAVAIEPASAGVVTGSGSYVSGTVVRPTYTITDPYTYEFDRWEGCDSVSGSDCTITMSSNKTAKVFLKKIPAELSCSVTPQSGLSPLVVKVTAKFRGLGSNPVFDYNFGDNSETQVGRPSVVYYTYSEAGTYTVKVSNSGYKGGQPQECQPSSVTVNNSSSGSGGEIVP